MPKYRTMRSVKKRFKITGTGRLRRRRATVSHNLAKRNRKLKRHHNQDAEVHSTNLKQVERLFG